MRRFTVLPPIVTLLVAAAGVQAGRLVQQQRELVIRTEVIPVPVTVLKGGKFVTDLKQQDFEVFEDGKAQELTSFALEDSGIAAVLLLDTSGSMGQRIDEAKRAAVQFVRNMQSNDVAKVIQFDDRVTALSEFTSDRTMLEAAIARARIGEATSLYNALYTAFAELGARKKAGVDGQRHRAVIVLTDGDDTASALTSDEVMQAAQKVDALTYAISLDRVVDGRPAMDTHSAIFLGQLAGQNGGMLLFPDVSDLQRRYRELADELHHQYVLGYVPEAQTRSSWHKITVRVKNRRDLTLRYRPGYYGSPLPATQQ
jgi:Ca-activated chloride channel homolog